jgi:NitT/TauT family transport system ATP-binding protein
VEVSLSDEISVNATRVEMRFASGQLGVRDVNLAVRRGELISLVGPSGCGKSTLLRMIAGLMSPTSGELRVSAASAPLPLGEGGRRPGEGRLALDSQSKDSVVRAADLKSETQTLRVPHPSPLPEGEGTAAGDPRIAFVFQDSNLLPWRNVFDNIRLPLELRGEAVEKQQAAVEESLKLIGLKPEDSAKRPSMLSGGMRMRVSLARALVTHPELLLLDEPFAALDDLLRQQLNEELLRIWGEQRWTGLFVTHNVAEAVFLSQRVLVMSKSPGTFIADIAVPFEHPRDPDLRSTAEFAKLTGEVSRKLREAAR